MKSLYCERLWPLEGNRIRLLGPKFSTDPGNRHPRRTLARSTIKRLGQNRRSPEKPRYPFVAQAELSENAFQTRLFARVTEISVNGCYLDMMNPLPTGTEVFVKIFTTEDFFESAATVVYSQPNLGMGLAFHDVSRHFLPSLQKWLLEAMQAAASEQL